MVAQRKDADHKGSNIISRDCVITRNYKQRNNGLSEEVLLQKSQQSYSFIALAMFHADMIESRDCFNCLQFFISNSRL